MEYFAESTEAYFSRNDFFPFTREELKKHDPAMFELLAKLWVTDNVSTTDRELATLASQLAKEPPPGPLKADRAQRAARR